LLDHLIDNVHPSWLSRSVTVQQSIEGLMLSMLMANRIRFDPTAIDHKPKSGKQSPSALQH